MNFPTTAQSNNHRNHCPGEDKSGAGVRASWDDVNMNNLIDDGEGLYWSWNSTGHTTVWCRYSLKVSARTIFTIFDNMVDPIRGSYLDNTNIYQVMHWVMNGYLPYNIHLPFINIIVEMNK
jgi:hypothetical protein